MHYKTIVLGLLQDRPGLHRSLQASGMLLSTLDRHASELKASHEAWMGRLSQARPGNDPVQIASEALEIALEELGRRLPSGSPPDEAEGPSLDGAMAFLRRHMPPA